jgi:TfoX/Sxy family transcriptional regulator of competence genes
MTAETGWTVKVRAALAGAGALREVRMFGGIGLMLNGNWVAAVSKRGLLLRVGPERQAQALARPGTGPMVMGGRSMHGYVYIDPPALDARAIEAGLALTIPFVQSLPAKTANARGGRK